MRNNKIALFFLFVFFSQGIFCSSQRLISYNAFLNDTEGDYRSILKGKNPYNVRVIVRNRKENQAGLNRHLKSHPINSPAEARQALQQFSKEEYPLHIIVQVGQYSNHFIYKEPQGTGSQIVLNYNSERIQIFKQFIYISNEEFFIGGIRFIKTKDKKWMLEKVILWRTGFTPPFLKKKYHIGNFRKVF